MKRITIALDDASMLTSQAEEIADVKLAFVQNCGECEFVEHDVQKLHDMPRTDVLVVDFGGLGIGFNTGRAERCGHALMRLIDSKQGTLFVLWSQHTEQWYKSAMIDAMPAGERDDATEPPAPPNVLAYSAKNTLTFWPQIRAWLGMTEEPERTPELVKLIESYESLCDAFRNDLANEIYGERAPTVPDIDEVCRQAVIDEQAETDAEVKLAELRRAELDVLRAQRKADGTENDFHANVPKEADGGPTYGDLLGEITVPVRLEYRPGITKGFSTFKFQDCLVEVTNTETGVNIANFGGTMGGGYMAHFNEVAGVSPSITYILTRQDIWKVFEAFHEKYTKDHPELLGYTQKGASIVAKLGT